MQIFCQKIQCHGRGQEASYSSDCCCFSVAGGVLALSSVLNYFCSCVFLGCPKSLSIWPWGHDSGPVFEQRMPGHSAEELSDCITDQTSICSLYHTVCICTWELRPIKCKLEIRCAEQTVFRRTQWVCTGMKWLKTAFKCGLESEMEQICSLYQGVYMQTNRTATCLIARKMFNCSQFYYFSLNVTMKLKQTFFNGMLQCIL